MHGPRCPHCGSEDVCQDWLRKHEYGWICDHCSHEWDVERTEPED